MKVLISPGYGTGWSTWAEDEEVARYVRTYQPIIDAIEKGEDYMPLVDALEKELEEKDKFFYTGGADDLVVVEVEPPFYIHGYDGYESVVTPSDYNWITE